MPAKKYYCDYCDKQFQDTPGDRKRHNRGIQHQQAKARWYDSLKFQNQHQQFPPKPLCFHFLNTGFCSYGDSCNYLHPDPNTNIITTPEPVNNEVRDRMGVPRENLPPSLQPPPEGGYPLLPFLDWG